MNRQQILEKLSANSDLLDYADALCNYLQQETLFTIDNIAGNSKTKRKDRQRRLNNMKLKETVRIPFKNLESGQEFYLDLLYEGYTYTKADYHNYYGITHHLIPVDPEKIVDVPKSNIKNRRLIKEGSLLKSMKYKDLDIGDEFILSTDDFYNHNIFTKEYIPHLSKFNSYTQYSANGTACIISNDDLVYTVNKEFKESKEKRLIRNNSYWKSMKYKDLDIGDEFIYLIYDKCNEKAVFIKDSKTTAINKITQEKRVVIPKQSIWTTYKPSDSIDPKYKEILKNIKDSVEIYQQEKNDMKYTESEDFGNLDIGDVFCDSMNTVYTKVNDRAAVCKDSPSVQLFDLDTTVYITKELHDIIGKRHNKEDCYNNNNNNLYSNIKIDWGNGNDKSATISYTQNKKSDIPKELEWILHKTEEQTPEQQSFQTDGSKADANKPKIRKGMIEHFPFAVIALALLSEYGANKYSWENWKHVNNLVERYGDAEGRHIIENLFDEQDESGFLHATNEAWCAVAKLDGILREKYSELKGE